LIAVNVAAKARRCSSAMAAADTRTRYAGPVVLRDGFRPFFLLAGLWAAGALALWLGALAGAVALPSHLDPLTWHAHAMVYGFATAPLTGFLLTAVPNWTGRLPVRGAPLAWLVGLWLAGRLAMLAGAAIGPATAAAIDIGFLVVLCGVMAREVGTGRNWRNLPVVALVGAMAAGNVVFHLDALDVIATAGGALRLGLAVMVLLIALVGGRVVPSFTRNWLVKRGPGPLPIPFNAFDRVALVVAVLALLAWTVQPEGVVTGGLGLLAGAVHALRLARWRGWRTGAESLVLVLHLAYAWLPIGFLALGIEALAPGTLGPAALHAFGAGAIGTMTLAIMTRAARGHSGRTLVADTGTTLAYACVIAGALLRTAAPLLPFDPMHAFGLSAVLWGGGFLLFAIAYAPMLLTDRR
jgi:uncharacterized protein involved in response to NO